MDSRTEALYGRPISKSHVVRAYTEETQLYKVVNACLRENHDLIAHGNFVYHCKQKLKQEYESGKIFEGECYRGVNLDGATMQEYRPGREFLWPAFNSASRDLTKAFTGNVLFQIDCDGKGITYAVDIAHLSVYPSEQEVLIYPYSGFVVTDVDTLFNKKLIRLRVQDTLLVERHLA